MFDRRRDTHDKIYGDTFVTERFLSVAHESTFVPSPQLTRTEARQQSRRGKSQNGRVVFNDVQRKTLYSIFKKVRKPDRSLQHRIASHLRLEVGLFFCQRTTLGWPA